MTNDNHIKLAITCVHWKKGVVLLSSLKPEHPRDSGNLYACLECQRKEQEKEGFMKDINNWTSICENCLSEHIIHSA